MTIKKFHNFFVTEQDILVHNIAFILGAIWGFEITLDIAAPIFIAGGSWLYNKITGKKYCLKPSCNNKWRHFFGKNNGPKHNFNGKDVNKIFCYADSYVLKMAAEGKLQEGINELETVYNGSIFIIRAYVIGEMIDIGTMFFK